MLAKHRLELNYAERYTHYRVPSKVPARFRQIVCMCLDSEATKNMYDPAAKIHYSIKVCAKCHKISRLDLKLCLTCRKWFIKDFGRENSNCVIHLKCLDCLESTETCCEFADRSWTKVDRVWGPLDINPAERSYEELDSIDIDDLTI